MANQGTIAAVVLTILGGIAIAASAAWLAAYHYSYATLPGMPAAWFGVGVILGIITIIAGAVMWDARAQLAMGILAIILALVSIPFSFAGYIVGFVLTIVGGVLAVYYRPMAGRQPAGT